MNPDPGPASRPDRPEPAQAPTDAFERAATLRRRLHAAFGIADAYEPAQADTDARAVYIAEVIWFGDNPVDGRTRLAVCATLDLAVHALRTHHIYGGDLAATETTSALGTKEARTWAVHERGTEPDDEGLLWITREEVSRA